MKKLNVYATVVNINGKKSSGREDSGSYKNWRALNNFEAGHWAED